jgi:hypothetical protein
MISRTHAKKEVMRLSSTSYFPIHKQALSELVDCLQLRSRSVEHATLVISEALDTGTNCPTVADLTKLCSEVGQKANKYPPPCPECEPLGGNWRTVTVEHKGRRVEAATRCDCARGALLAAREEEEKRNAER